MNGSKIRDTCKEECDKKQQMKNHELIYKTERERESESSVTDLLTPRAMKSRFQLTLKQPNNDRLIAQ